MNLDEAKRYLGDRWLLSPGYRRQAHHSPYHTVDVRETIRRAKIQEGRPVQEVGTGLRGMGDEARA